MVSLHLLYTPQLGHLLLQKYRQNVTVNMFGSGIRTWSKAGSSHFPLWSKTLQGTVSTLEKERAAEFELSQHHNRLTHSNDTNS